MKNFRETFDKWISSKVDFQIAEIDKIAVNLDIDVEKWFKSEILIRNSGDYSGTDILNYLLSHFTFYISREFEILLCKYVTPKGYNIYHEPYLGFNIDYDEKIGFFLRKKDKKKIKKIFNELNINKKQELLKNNLFSYMVNKTNMEIFSKKEIRLLKLKNINEYYSIIET